MSDPWSLVQDGECQDRSFAFFTICITEVEIVLQNCLASICSLLAATDPPCVVAFVSSWVLRTAGAVLTQNGVLTKVVPQWPGLPKGHPYEHLQARNYTFAKLEAFRLEQYRGLATFDVDVLFMRNASALAEVGPLAASRFPKGPNPASYLNTGVMVLRPSGRLYSEILATLHRGNYSLHYSDDEMTEQDVLIELCVLQGRCGDLHDLDACVYNHGAWIPGTHPRRCRRNSVVARHNFAATRETVLANSLQTAMYRGTCRARTGAGRPRTCWSQDYHEEMCCRQDLRFGNPQCWGAGLSYERCCLGVDDSQRLRAELKYAGPSWYGLSSSPEPLPSRFIQAQCVNKYLPMRMTLAGMSSIMEAPADLEESYDRTQWEVDGLPDRLAAWGTKCLGLR
ncbi:unnamed protein product, partial [Polarella glacialis]